MNDVSHKEKLSTETYEIKYKTPGSDADTFQQSLKPWLQEYSVTTKELICRLVAKNDTMFSLFVDDPVSLINNKNTGENELGNHVKNGTPVILQD